MQRRPTCLEGIAPYGHTPNVLSLCYPKTDVGESGRWLGLSREEAEVDVQGQDGTFMIYAALAAGKNQSQCTRPDRDTGSIRYSVYVTFATIR